MEYICLHCGTVLTEENSRTVPSNKSGFSQYCIECEQDYYAKLAEAEGASLALFHCCAAFNVPCIPMALENFDISKSENLWIDYLNQLEQYKEDNKLRTLDSFFDGVTNIFKIFGRALSQKDFAEHIKFERQRLNAMPGTIAQRARWGTKDNFTADDYNALDAAYSNRAESYKGQELTPQMQDVLQKVVKWSFQADELIRMRNYDGAKKLIDMTDKLLASENMRKKDEKPIEGYSLDTQVVALERAGLMEEGKFLDLDGVQHALARMLKSKKYDYSVDVLDHSMEMYLKTMMANADALIPSELPEDVDFDDEYGEFEDEPTATEKETIKFAGLAPIIYQKKEKSGNKTKEGD